jgi:hypothetical protein
MNKLNVRKTRDSTWDYECKADSAIATLDVAYTDDAATWVPRCPLLGSEISDIPGLLLQRVKAAKMDGDQIRVVLHYEGTSRKAPGRDPEAEPVKRYDVEMSPGEESILAHPKYAALTEVERRGLLSIINGVEVDMVGCAWENALTGELAMNALLKIRKGFVAYLKNGTTYVERSTTESLADMHFTLACKKDNPPGPVAPMPGHWLYLGASASNSADGLSWSLERRWRYSEDIWDEIYDPV